MTDWADLHPLLAAAVVKLPVQGWLRVWRDAPEASLQLGRVEGVLRAEVCNETPDDEPRLRDRGWTMTDSWSGVWRRDWPWPGDVAAAEGAVAETTHALRNLWRIAKPDGFTYLAWQEAEEKAAWQFWKSGADKELNFPELGLPKGKPKKD